MYWVLLNGIKVHAHTGLYIDSICLDWDAEVGALAITADISQLSYHFMSILQPTHQLEIQRSLSIHRQENYPPPD